LQSDYTDYPEFAEGASPPERLSDRLADGRLPLDQALSCAADLALALRELHAAGRAHGSVTPVFVALDSNRAALLPASGGIGTPTQAGDVAAFGALLYEMLVGRKPTGDAFAPAAVRSLCGTSWTPAFESALRVAEKCMAAAPDAVPNLRNIASEVRLLLVTARGTEPPDPVIAPRPSEKTQSAGAVLPPSDSDDPSAIPADMPCPRCGSREVYISKRRSRLESFLGRFNIPFYRCHRCFHRFMIILRIKITKVKRW
jgi:DNA-directed RNA polymerase subunit M/transcription elongation factor TFIIS